MSCNLSQGESLPCKTYIGGVKEVFFIPSVAYDRFIAALTIDATTQVVTDIDGAASAFTAYRYELKVGAGNSFVETPEFSEEGGAAYNQELQISLLGFGAALRKELIKMVIQRKMIIVVRDSNNNLQLMGYDNGAEVSAGTIDRGIQMSDFYGRKLTFMSKTSQPAYFLAPYTAIPFDNFVSVEVSPAYDL
jgi:hypothetical protein